MALDRARDAGAPTRFDGRAPHRWPVWRLPARVLGPVLVVETAALALVVVGLAGRPSLTSDEVRHAAVLCLLGVAYNEMSVRVERERRRLSRVDHVDLSSVWTFAGALVLPGPYAALVATVLMAHLWARAWRGQIPLHRTVFHIASVVLACTATAGVLDRLDPGAGPADHELWVVLTAGSTYAVVGTGLIALVVAVGTPRASARTVLGAWDENLLEIGTLCLGALVALALAMNPWLVLFVLPPLLALLRAVLIRPLVAAASTDGKTGLLNAATWYAEADRILRRSGSVERACGVLVLDLDHFKAVNDTYGHVVGDRVLAAVADVLRREVRAHDVVGRLGGEEFVVMPMAAAYGARSVELEVVAERIRARVADLRVEVPTPKGPLTVSGLSASIGGAVAPVVGADLACLLQTADVALYAAKRAGRNRVQVQIAPPVQPGPVRPAGPEEQSPAAE